ncbi:MAG: hypothetical protein ABIJ97_04410, partial [Bacteroidota bacterium]
MNKWNLLNGVEKTTFKLHLGYAACDGIIIGTFALNEFIFIKSLKGSDFHLSLLFAFSMAVFILLVFVNEFLKRIQNKKKLLRYTALITRLPLLTFIFFPEIS